MSEKYKRVANYGKIYIEDLNIAGMVKNHKLAQSVSDTSWGKFFELLNYKAEEAGRKVVKIPRFEPSSKKCSACGAINQELKLSDRQWVCKESIILKIKEEVNARIYSSLQSRKRYDRNAQNECQKQNRSTQSIAQ